MTTSVANESTYNRAFWYHILSQHHRRPNHRLKIRLTVRWWVTSFWSLFNSCGIDYCSITVKIVINVVTLSKDKKHCDPIFPNQSWVLPNLFEIFLDHMPSCHFWISFVSALFMFNQIQGYKDMLIFIFVFWWRVIIIFRFYLNFTDFGPTQHIWKMTVLLN